MEAASQACAIMVGRYTHAHQFKRARRELKFLRTRLGRIIRDIRRKIEGNTASIACQTKCPGRLLQCGWAPQEKRGLAWAPRWQASIRHDDRRSRARWNVDGDHKSSIWFSTTDAARELVCADVGLSGYHCELTSALEAVRPRRRGD